METLLFLGVPILKHIRVITKSNKPIIRVLPFLNSPKDLDPPYKMDLDFWDCLGRKKKISVL